MTEMNRRDALRLLCTAASMAMISPHQGLASESASGPTPTGAMLSRNVPSSGEALPVIGLGTSRTFDVGDSPAERAPLEDVMSSFVALGGKLIDSSPMYGSAEEVVGDLAAKLDLRPRLFLATKVWTSGKQAGIEQMQNSMRKLRTDRIDLMQVHNLLDVDTHLDTLQTWKREGRVRYIGITHYLASAQDAVAQIVAARPLDFIQINYSVAEREAERRLLPLARDRGVAVIANRPFGAGGLLRRVAGRPLPDWADGNKLHELGSTAAQVRGFPSRRDVRDSRDVQRGAPARQHAGGFRAAAGRRDPEPHRRRCPRLGHLGIRRPPLLLCRERQRLASEGEPGERKIQTARSPASTSRRPTRSALLTRPSASIRSMSLAARL